SRLSPEYPRDVPLLRAARSVCRDRHRDQHRERHRERHRDHREHRHRDPRGPWSESLYQGAVFQLRRGDQLAATASGGQFLDLHGTGQVYF
ncbi:TNFA factor, partial [Poecile atricapillus]|nr:TNFA factor [Poecile atricapillus]